MNAEDEARLLANFSRKYWAHIYYTVVLVSVSAYFTYSHIAIGKSESGRDHFSQNMNRNFKISRHKKLVSVNTRLLPLQVNCMAEVFSLSTRYTQYQASTHATKHLHIYTSTHATRHLYMLHPIPGIYIGRAASNITLLLLFRSSIPQLTAYSISPQFCGMVTKTDYFEQNLDRVAIVAMETLGNPWIATQCFIPPVSGHTFESLSPSWEHLPRNRSFEVSVRNVTLR